MAGLFNTIAEVQKYASVTAGLDISSLDPFLTDSLAEAEVIKILGFNLYDQLLTAYQGNALTLELQALLPKVQAPLAPLALYYFLQEGNVQITSAGAVADRDKSAFQWQQLKFEDAQLKTAYYRLDRLIAFLHTNKANYDGWDETSEFAATREFFINSPDVFQKWVNIGSSYRTLVSLRPPMREVEENKIRPALGDGLFEELKAAILNDGLSADQNALMRFIIPATAQLTIAQGIEEVNLEITPEGAYNHSLRAQSAANIKEKTPANAQQLAQAAERLATRGGNWLQQLTDYLNANASESRYPSYFNSALYTEPVSTSFRGQENGDKLYNAL